MPLLGGSGKINGRVNLTNPYVRALKIFFNVKKMVDNDLVNALKKLEIVDAGLYGSWANGARLRRERPRHLVKG